MNKKDIILIVGVLLVIVLAIFLTGGESGNKIELPLKLSGEDTGVVSIGYTEYQTKVDNGENFIVVIEQTGCGYCEMYAPVVKEVAEEYNIPVYDINIAEISDEDKASLEESNSYLKRNNWGTPTTLLMSGDRVVGSLGGAVEKDGFVDFIKSYVKLDNDENKEENDVE